MKISDLQLGKAGEYLVCADLISKGFIAYPSEWGLHYDVVCDVDGKLKRIQVRTTRTSHRGYRKHKNRTPAYLFCVRRFGKGRRKKFTENEVDIFAFVILNEHKIGYVPVNKVQTTMQFRTEKFKGQYRDEIAEENKKKILKYRNLDWPYRKISKELDISERRVRYVCNERKDSKNYRIKRRYLEEFSFKKALDGLER